MEEFIEIASIGNIAGYTIVLYSGNNVLNFVYRSTVVPTGSGPTTVGGVTVTVSTSDGITYTVLDYPTDGIQNDTPEGIALVDPNGLVVEFLSYEGRFIASNGPAIFQRSVDIGFRENRNTPVGFSLQRTIGETTWAVPRLSTKGRANTISTPNPTATPITSNPTATPVTSNPTATPVTSNPTATPITSNPTATPVTSNPTAAPVIIQVRLDILQISYKCCFKAPHHCARFFSQNRSFLSSICFHSFM